jgi:DNA-binding NarL/FixJ family response regulator
MAAVTRRPSAPVVELDDVDVRILRRCSRGESVDQVARAMGLSRDTVSRRLLRIRRGWGAPNTIAAVVVAVRRGVI